MSIQSINLETFEQVFKMPPEHKIKYGAVTTDFKLINKILDLLPLYLFNNPNIKWLDPCAGTGYFSMVLYKRLFNSLQNQIKSVRKRHNHIIHNMIWMVEINPNYIPQLYEIFGNDCNILSGDFLECSNMEFDVIIGNPPFNSAGIKKVPTKGGISKTKDGKAIWIPFLTNCIANLKKNGFLAMITPSIWMKRDHAMFKYLKQWDIKRIRCLSNTETNTIFHKQAQTPTCYFSLLKRRDYTYPKNLRTVHIWDKALRMYVPFVLSAKSLPLIVPSIIKKLLSKVYIYGSIEVIKTSMRPDYKGLSLMKIPDLKHPYPNISTCILNKLDPTLVINYSNKKCVLSGQSKLVLAHKMYGFPYYDKEGIYGISNRDNYAILHKTERQIRRLKAFLSTKLALVVYESTRYRMKYLEKYAFEFLPDITKISWFPTEINDETIAEFFNFNEVERNYINNITKKNYGKFV